MALVRCPKCKKEISDKAERCIHCGYPMNEIKKIPSEFDGLQKEEFESNISVTDINTEKNNNIKRDKKKYKWLIAIAIISCIFLFVVIILFFTRDKEPPKITNLPQQIEAKVGDKLDVDNLLDKIEIFDNKSENLTYTVQSDMVDMNIPGEYYLTIEAYDEAGNVSKERIKVIITDYPVHLAYLDAVNLESSQLEVNSLGYSFNGININNGELEYLEDGAIYRSIAKQLDDFYFGEMYYPYWDTDISEAVFGITISKDYQEMKSYIDRVSSYITLDSTLPQIMTWIQGTSTASGTFEYETGFFSFQISDLSVAANEMGISEKMLGYILAVIEEYAPETSFEGNTYSCELQVGGNVTNVDRNILTYEDFNNTQGAPFSPLTFENVVSVANSEGINCRWFFYDDKVDLFKEYVVSTNRKISIGMSYNSVVYQYGKGNEGTVDFKTDSFYNLLCESAKDDTSDFFRNQVKTYMSYKTQDGKDEIVFFFDENNEVSWIIYFLNTSYY